MKAFDDNVTQLFDAIEDCLAKERLLPCLTLLYSGIDVVASLERKTGERIGDAFVRWTEENLLQAHPLPCTGLELYAARCGIIHTFTSESDLSRRGSARQIIYVWGAASIEDLAETARRLGRTDVPLRIRDLIDAFRAGVARHLEEVGRSQERQQLFETRAGLWFTHMDRDLVKKFLDISQP